MRTLNQRIRTVFLVFVFFCAFFLFGIPSSAADLPRLVDQADLLTDSEESALSDRLDEISERHQFDVVVVTVDSLEGETAVVYADDFYDYNGYGFGDERDGILLLISMEERDWCISTTGYGITAFTDAGQAYISERFVTDLSVGDYAAAFTNFAVLCDAFITQADTGEPYDIDHLPQEPFDLVWNLAVALIIAFVISLIVTGIMRGQLKTVHSQSEADNYIKQGSMHLTRKNDLYLYRHVDRRKKAENNSSTRSGNPGGSQTHKSSSGTTHGGSSGKF
ncbi:MAG: TPM domain-containing protein [Lachnospiraceae bacterium]|jgi:uncharacterized protein